MADNYKVACELDELVRTIQRVLGQETNLRTYYYSPLVEDLYIEIMRKDNYSQANGHINDRQF